MPITRIDGCSIGGRVGPVTATIRAHYWALHERPDYTTLPDCTTPPDYTISIDMDAVEG